MLEPHNKKASINCLPLVANKTYQIRSSFSVYIDDIRREGWVTETLSDKNLHNVKKKPAKKTWPFVPEAWHCTSLYSTYSTGAVLKEDFLFMYLWFNWTWYLCHMSSSNVPSVLPVLNCIISNQAKITKICLSSWKSSVVFNKHDQQ